MKTKIEKFRILSLAIITVLAAIFSISCEDNTTAPRDTTPSHATYASPLGSVSTTAEATILTTHIP